MLLLLGDLQNLICHFRRNLTGWRQTELGTQGMPVAWISLQQSDRHEMIKALQKSRPARAGRSQQCCLPPRDAEMELVENGQRPCPCADLDNEVYVHNV